MGFPFTLAECMSDIPKKSIRLKEFLHAWGNVPRHVPYWTAFTTGRGHHMSSIAGQYASAATKKMRRPRKKQLRRALRKQLGYLRRNLVSIGRLKEYHRESPHTDSHELTLETIRELYHQQKYMYDHKTQSVPNRIVSISQPHVRPIVRGKAEPTLSSALSWPSAL